MSILFYSRRGADPDHETPDPPAGLSVQVWRPAEQGPALHGPRPLHNLAWWLFDRAGIFARRDFVEISIWRESRMLHRLIVTPRWGRFPFMDRGDLQLGDLWTHPAVRRQGLARMAIAEAHRRFGADTVRFWYVVSLENRASARLVESCGYRLTGVGRRTRPMGVAAIGQYRLELGFS